MPLFRKQSAAVLPSLAPHGVRRGCNRCRIAGIHGEAMYTALTLRSACSSSSCKPAMSGVEGPSPRLSLGDSKGVFSSEREYPLWCCGAHAAFSLRALRGKQPLPRGSAKKKQPFRAAPSRSLAGASAVQCAALRFNPPPARRRSPRRSSAGRAYHSPRSSPSRRRRPARR